MQGFSDTSRYQTSLKGQRYHLVFDYDYAETCMYWFINEMFDRIFIHIDMKSRLAMQ